MKLALLTLFVLAITVVVHCQIPPQGVKVEPAPHPEHSPGNPPVLPAGSPQSNASASSNAAGAATSSNNTSSAGGNIQTNQSVPKPENSPKAEPPVGGEPKPKGEPPADHERDHEHSPGNPKHDRMGGAAGDMRAAHFLLMIAAVAPFLLTMLAL